MSDQDQLEMIKSRIESAPVEEIPSICGALAELDARARLRLSEGRDSSGSDRLIKIEEAAELLGVSTHRLYKTKEQYPFFCREGQSVRFSLRGIRDYIAGKAHGKAETE